MKKVIKYLLTLFAGLALLSYGLFFWPVWGVPFQAQRDTLDYQYDAHRQKLIIRTDHYQQGTYRIQP